MINSLPSYIPFGNGRSYGDSAISENIIDIKPLNYFISFNDTNGLLNVESGVLLSEILEVFVRKGWFLKVVPGTKYITVGGAIAADIHGKNHHIDGCFSNTLHSFRLMLPNGSIKECSQTENVELYRATCGGMGLTGFILDVKLYLKKIKSVYLNQTTFKASNLQDLYKAFDDYHEMPYSVAWIDCLAKKEKIGRGIFMGGSFCNDGLLEYKKGKKINIPFNFPSFSLNQTTVRAFNWFYYNKTLNRVSKSRIHFDNFFFPLDSIQNWNRIYGKNGFTQYQFILPKKNSFEGMSKILNKISQSGMGSFLAVLKLYGENNKNYLSFPIKGHSLALDFKIQKKLFPLLDELDTIVNNHKGRIYLAKDVRIKRKEFQKGYPDLDKFMEIRNKYLCSTKINSLQSNRLKI